MSRIIQINEFSFDQMISNPRILIIGKHEFRKTILITEILDYLNAKESRGSLYIFASDSNAQYYSDFQEIKIMHEFNDNKIAEILVENNNKIIIFDGIIDTNFKNNDYFREILLCGQQHRITLIIIAQYISSISKDFRSKFDYIFIFQDNTEKELMQIYDTYRTVSDFEQFYNLFNTIISNCCAAILDKTQYTDDIDKKIFYYGMFDKSNNVLNVSSDSGQLKSELVSVTTFDDCSNHISQNYSSGLNISYFDNNYNLSLSLNMINVNNDSIVKLITEHILSIKKIELEKIKYEKSCLKNKDIN
uniref:Uncharacterized protein n=1 Tax=viral metagenome TaxID=1070528 RepID=A0A6C0LUM9_9ZZZZ